MDNDDQLSFPILEEEYHTHHRMCVLVDEFLEEFSASALLRSLRDIESARRELLLAHPDELSLRATLGIVQGVFAEDGHAVLETLVPVLTETRRLGGRVCESLTPAALTVLMGAHPPGNPGDERALHEHLVAGLGLGPHPPGSAPVCDDAVGEVTVGEARAMVRLARSVRHEHPRIRSGDVVLSVGIVRLLRLARDNPASAEMPEEWLSGLVCEAIRDQGRLGSARISSAMYTAGIVEEVPW